MPLAGIRAPPASKSSPASTCWITSRSCAPRQPFWNPQQPTLKKGETIAQLLADKAGAR
jgi:hypothetical protein